MSKKTTIPAINLVNIFEMFAASKINTSFVLSVFLYFDLSALRVQRHSMLHNHNIDLLDYVWLQLTAGIECR